MEQANAPRTYVVETPTGQVYRNRSHLTIVPETEPPAQPEPSQPEPPAEPLQEMNAQPPSGNHPSTAIPSLPRTRSQTGTLIPKPNYLEGEMWQGLINLLLMLLPGARMRGRGRVVSCVCLSVCLFVGLSVLSFLTCSGIQGLFEVSLASIKMALDSKRVFLHPVFENDRPEAQKSLFSCDLDAS